MRRLILGPPGTGKTTRLLNLVDDYIASGVAPERIAFLAFTRAAANEAVTRAVERFGVARTRFPYFRTLHSLAYRMLGLNRHEVMGEDQWEQFGASIGARLAPNALRAAALWEPTGLSRSHDGEALRCYLLARARCLSIEDEWAATAYDVPLWYVQRFVASLDAFKSENTLLDYADFLDSTTHALDVDVVIVDEAQDLTQQQWRLLQRLAARARDVIAAGDDDQAIYRWAGADLSTLLALDWDREVLPISYRLPAPIKEYAERIISRAARRFAKPFAAAPHAGRVDVMSARQVEIDSGSWLLLARTHSQTAELLGIARSSGRVYEYNGMRSTDTPAVRAVIAYTSLCAGRAIPAKDWPSLRALWAAARGYGVAGMREIEPALLPDAARADVERKRPWWEALDVSPYESTYIRALLRRGEKLSQPAAVRVRTIHAAKGAEAESVLLLGKPAAHRQVDLEEEVRVWYVGATRARCRLVLAQHDGNALLG